MKEVEKEVNIWDMFLFICQKWRVLIGTGIVLMVLLGAFGAYKNKIESSGQQSFNGEVSLDALALVDKNRVQQYLLAEDIYEDVVEQNANDELLSLDYFNIYRANAEYIIEGNDDNVVIASVLEDKVDAVWNSATDISQFNESSLVYDSSVSIYDGEGSKQQKSVVLSIVVYGVDKENCQNSLQDVEKILKEAEKELKNIFGHYQMKCIEGEIYVSSCDRLQNYINEKKNFEYTKLNNKVTVSAALSESAKQYVEEYKKADVTGEVDAEDKVISENSEKKGFSAFINIKYLLLGFVGGNMLAAAMYCIIYVMNTRVRFEDDIELEYGLNLLGRVSGEQKGNKLDKWLINLRRKNIHDFTYQEIVEIIASEIKVKALRLGVHKVYATGCTMGEQQKSLVKDIAKVLAASNIELITGKSILYYPEALEESSEVGNIVLIEKCNESRYMEIEQEIRKAETRGLDIAGVVLVE